MKRRSIILIIVGFVLAYQFQFLRITGVIQPSGFWDWKYDVSGILSVIGAIIGVIGVISLMKILRKSKSS